jgi:hypothetical protein
MRRTGKDLKTVLSESLDPDAMILRIKNSEKLPRITREVLTEELIDMKKDIKEMQVKAPIC